MPRTARILTNCSSYHIIARGIRRDEVFLDDDDFQHYLNLLWKYKNGFSAQVYAYCLMSNHVHLLLYPTEPRALASIMHGINLSYAQHFNHKYKKCGHLWQNRYKSFPVQNDEYLINIISYIEYNPIRANICNRAEEYRWSSYRSRTLGENNKVLDIYKP